MLVVVINGKTVLEYQPHSRLPGHVRKLLDEMDADMAAGLQLAGEFIDRPGTLQCARFVGMKLIQAIESRNAALQAATCAWLCSRLPALERIDASETGDQVNMQLIME